MKTKRNVCWKGGDWRGKGSEFSMRYASWFSHSLLGIKTSPESGLAKEPLPSSWIVPVISANNSDYVWSSGSFCCIFIYFSPKLRKEQKAILFSAEGVKKKERERKLVNLLRSNFTCFCCDLKSIILTSWHWVRSASVYFVLTRTGKLDPEVKRSFLFSEVA